MVSDLKDKFIGFLRWSERYTKTDMVYLASGTSLSLLGQGAAIAASLALAVAVNHFLTKEIYGTYKFILSIVAIISLFSLTGIGSAVFQSAAQGFDGALRKGFWENIQWSVFVFLGGLGTGIYYFLNGNSTIAVGVLIGASFSPFIASASLFGPFLGGKKDFWHQTVYGIADNIFPILILIGVIIVTSNPIILVSTYFVTNALAALFFYGRTIEKYHANLHRDDPEFSNYSKHLSAMSIIGGVADRLDQILLFHYVGAAQLAIYNFALAFPVEARGPVKNLSAMIQAQFAQRPTQEIRKNLERKTFLILILAVVATAIYIFVAPHIFRILFPAYQDAITYSQIYSLWILTVPLDPFTTFLSAKKLTTQLYTIYIFASITQVVSMVIGVIVWGLMGLIVARLIARLLMGIAGYFLYRGVVAREETA